MFTLIKYGTSLLCLTLEQHKSEITFLSRFPFVPGREVMVYSDADKLPEMFCEGG